MVVPFRTRPAVPAWVTEYRLRARRRVNPEVVGEALPVGRPPLNCSTGRPAR